MVKKVSHLSTKKRILQCLESRKKTVGRRRGKNEIETRKLEEGRLGADEEEGMLKVSNRK